ncbi:DNA mismatch repair protein MutL [Oribacterium sinus]|uniref:DNA mismatch repair protein MutL n=1 Tax=Oribacterium sinus TaxID=237576 RepID=A0A7W9W200_9FIRM|nr:DNA mismatch repair endonuclease MutL [Oribacterium sinus]MBB6041405.1 DNA mismatch repair protein MutL [Oribacterium sinus]
MKIHLLSQECINQIAAGEVVERPSSIVKELVENALDAKATAISIEIKGGGISFLRVSDNGEGIFSEDLERAFMPHATSKIQNPKDLEEILSFGFRGEALASIASVAKVECISKRQEDFLAHRILVEGGSFSPVEEVGGMDGTSILVRDLFYNVPARKKFLLSESTEASRVEEMVEKLALANPGISFHFVKDGKSRFQTLGGGKLSDVVFGIYGKSFAKDSLEIKESYYPSSLTGLATLHIEGLLGKPSLTRSNRQYEIFFVNGRFVRDSLLSRALEDAYKPFLMQHKFPFAIVFLHLSPNLVDVNVHPQKLEVRFQNREKIYQALFDCVSKTLSKADLIDHSPLSLFQKEKEEKSTTFLSPSSQLWEKKEEKKENKNDIPEEAVRSDQNDKQSAEQISAIKEQEKEKAEAVNQRYPIGEASEKAPFRIEVPELNQQKAETREEKLIYEEFDLTKGIRLEEEEKASEKEENTIPKEENTIPKEEQLFTESENLPSAEQESLFSTSFFSEEGEREFRLIGQVFQTYWLIEFQKELFIMDQHAAHEKVNFEKMRKNYLEKPGISQGILPKTMVFNAKEEELYEKTKDYFTHLGYRIRKEEEKRYALEGIPADFPSLDAEMLFHEILDALAEEGNLSEAESVYNKIASMSCKASVKGNQLLSFQEAEALVQKLFTLENPYACPHGRPTIVAFKKQDLEKMFKRIV